MNMWAEGRAYGYIRFKKSSPTGKLGVGRGPMAQSASAPVLMLLLLSIIATAEGETRLYFVGRPCLLRLLLSVRPLMVCKHCGNEARYHLEQGATGDSSPFPCYFKISDIKFILTVLYFNCLTINTQRVHAGYLRLFACVICP